ncbi:Transposon Tf2-1 polyprotein [Ceratobasidium sp. AG-Ba]|nr:Transposon Tf2-1 polyprotein [Ceratobasidium sp. AG-Ba]
MTYQESCNLKAEKLEKLFEHHCLVIEAPPSSQPTPSLFTDEKGHITLDAIIDPQQKVEVHDLSASSLQYGKHQATSQFCTLGVAMEHLNAENGRTLNLLDLGNNTSLFPQPPAVMKLDSDRYAFNSSEGMAGCDPCLPKRGWLIVSARWHMELASFNFEIHYRPGKMSNKPDALSRRHDHEDIPNPQQIMINAERFKGFKANIEIDIISMIRESLSDDESLTTLIESTRKKEDLPPSIRKQYDKCEWKKDLLWYEGQIPENKEIQLAILEMHHDNPIAGHQGQARTLELISRRYYWPAMKQQVSRFVETCETCQRSKGHKQYAPQKLLPIPQKPWEDIAYDFIVKLPESQGMDSILVVIDCFSRQAHFIPCLESTNAEGAADLFIKETTVSDRGPTFNSQFLKALYAKLGINPKFSSAFHPQTDGITERTNQWLEGFLRSFCNYRQDDWVRWLPIAEFCHNNQVNSATGKTAFETIYGLHPRWDIVDLEVNAPNAADMADSMQEIWDEVIASMEFYRSKESDPKREYKVGDKVWLVGWNITTRRPSKKLDNKKLGPFVISEKISSHAYRLELPKTMRIQDQTRSHDPLLQRIHNVFRINLLAPFTEDKDFHRRQARPPIVKEEGEEEYEVDHVVAWEQRKNGLYYQIRWKGYDPIEDTMERAEKIAGLPQIIEDLLKRHPKAPLPKSYKPNKEKYKRLQLYSRTTTTINKLFYTTSSSTMASTRTNKSAKATNVRYDPRNARVVANHSPKSVWGKQRVSHKLTWGHGGDRLYSYQDAIRRCDSFIRSSDFAKSLDPTVTHDYIPMGERWDCKWIGTHTLKCPKRGNLYWIGKGPRPELDEAMQATKIFVIEEWIGDEVEHVVEGVRKLKGMSWYRDYTETMKENTRAIKSLLNSLSTHHLIRRLEEWEREGKREAVPKWVEDSTEWWFRFSDIEEMKEGWIRSIGEKGQKMAIIAKAVKEWCQAPDISKSYQEVLKEITFGEVIELVEKETWSKRELLDWLDQKAWDKGNKDLSVDMADPLLEPLDKDKEWVKLKEEVWGAEAPNVLSNTLQATSQSQSLQETGAFDVLLARQAEDYNPKTKRLDTLHRAVVDASALDYIYEQPQEAATHQAKIRRRRRCIQNRNYLQKKPEEGVPEHCDITFHETFSLFAELMTDPFGNYLCQKLLEYLTNEQRNTIYESVADDSVGISLNMHGTHAVQKMIDFLSTQRQANLSSYDVQIHSIIMALSMRVVTLTKDLNGNHVVQKCLNRLIPEDNQLICNAVAAHCIEVTTHFHGCGVLQRCIDHAPDLQRIQLVTETTFNASTLVQDPYGNYVVQYILDLNDNRFSNAVIRQFVGNVCALSVQKFSLNVIEKDAAPGSCSQYPPGSCSQNPPEF